jgi:hypothetical protein
MVHDVRHFPVDVSQRNGSHDVLVVGVVQVPPLQTCPTTPVPATLHIVGVPGAPQPTPLCAIVRQAPAPSQLPSALQFCGYPGSALQSPRGFVSAAALPQTPSVPLPLRAAVHAWQVALQGVSQQTPSTQLPVAQTRHGPDLQSTPVAKLHMLPRAFCMVHVPLAPQNSPSPHCASEVHAEAHVAFAPSHAYGAHDGRPGDPAGASLHTPSGVPPSTKRLQS